MCDVVGGNSFAVPVSCADVVIPTDARVCSVPAQAEPAPCSKLSEGIQANYPAGRTRATPVVRCYG